MSITVITDDEAVGDRNSRRPGETVALRGRSDRIEIDADLGGLFRFESFG